MFMAMMCNDIPVSKSRLVSCVCVLARTPFLEKWWFPSQTGLESFSQLFGCEQLSNEKNPALLSIESWLFNKDPYKTVYHNPHITM